jgi:predicted Zn finger-like uncharacterized protein
MSTVRLRRLKADHAKLREYTRRHPRVRLLQADGDPPERYQLEYRVRSLQLVDGEPREAPSHIVEIALPRNYPRVAPQCRMLTPVFHPNIAPHAICVGDHWGAGESLQSIAARIGEILAYQSYNVKSPLNGEAARWAQENKARLPLDTVSMLIEEDATAPPRPDEPAAKPATPKWETPPDTINVEPRAAKPAPRPATPPAPAQAAIECPQCRARYQVAAGALGKKVRCVRCKTVFIAGLAAS